MRKIGFVFANLFAALFSAFLCSCSAGIMGYGVLLWNVPEHELEGGDIVPVYIKSNISNVYVIGLGTEKPEKKEKIEVPLWQLTEPESRSRVAKTARLYDEFKHTYATVVLDGLPMRAEPVNTARQVYRLRKDESIKILYKGTGQAVMAGANSALEGEWYRVLTGDGTQGWCFSYNLRFYEMDKNGQRIGGEEIVESDGLSEEVEQILSAVWYPDSYKSMIESGRIDIEKLNPSYMFHLDSDSRILYFNMPRIYKSWEYTGFTKFSGNEYKLNDIPIVLTVRRSDFIVVRYTGESGKPEDFNLVTIEEDLNGLVQNERTRRDEEYRKILDFGPDFRSSSYGNLEFRDDKSFSWTNNRLLAPSIIPSVKTRGNVQIKYFLSRSLSANYNGIITFTFEGIDKEVNFLYRIEENGLRFEDASDATIKNNIVTERSLSPLVIFFSKS